MTHTTDQERALADLRHMYAQMVGGMVKDSAQAKRIADGILSRAIQKLEQAARRAPAVPVPQGWLPVPIEPTQEMQDAMHTTGHAPTRYAVMLAAAPQPPQGTINHQMTDDGPSSCAHCGNPWGEAAPVQLPEPDSYIFQHEETGLTQFVDAQQVQWGFEKNNPRWKRVSSAYTEQQVRELLAAHDIQEQST